jgi:UTP--glucose-1-phosphate uridylyltransferase
MMEKAVRKAILPAAGLGTRFLPATKASPKEMLPIVDKPMIQYAVEEADRCGINEFIVITGKNKRAIEDHFDIALRLEDSLRRSGKEDVINELEWLNQLNFAYIRQGEALGLGHAIHCAKPFVKDEPFAVILSDDIIAPKDNLLEDMMKLYEEVESPVIALVKVDSSELSMYGIIDGTEERPGVYRLNDLVEKPKAEDAPSNLAIIGRYILTPDIFDVLEDLPPGRGGEIQLTDALNELLSKRPVYGYVFEGKRYDAGDKLGFLMATVDFALKNSNMSEKFRQYLIDTAERLKG